MTDETAAMAWPIDPSHTRHLDIALSVADPGVLDFRADVLDLRKAGLMSLGGRIATPGIIHNMTLFGRADDATGEILELSWNQSHVMHEANHASDGECCRDPMKRLSGLVGSRLGAGFRGDLKRHFGGPLGCSHVNTLFQELSATVARLHQLREDEPTLAEPRPSGARIARRAVFFDAFLPEEGTCSELRVRLSDAQYGSPDEIGNESMARHSEVRLAAQVDLMGWQLLGLRGSERARVGPEIEAGPWTDRNDVLEEFVDTSLGGGMARLCAERFGDDAAEACLLSALLALAPGMTQVGAGLSDSLVPSPVARPQKTGAPLTGAGPCYLLRGDGPLIQVITGPGGD
ncbi:MAG: DUF2889 domain-containing protein [bacterium]|nr:DUF2889 domain-containing protein [bacterium]